MAYTGSDSPGWFGGIEYLASLCSDKLATMAYWLRNQKLENHIGWAHHLAIRGQVPDLFEGNGASVRH